MHRILFLCMGNICRSPAAHCIFQHLVDQAGRSADFEIDSAGTIREHTGEPPDPRMRETLRERGIPVTGKARQIQPEDLETFDRILAMDKANLRHARNLAPNARHADKVRLFCNYCTEHTESEVPDPYYGGEGGFPHVVDILEDGCANLLRECLASKSGAETEAS